MLLRRNFLKQMAVTAAGLLVADDALELLVEPRKYWPGHDFHTGKVYGQSIMEAYYLSASEISELLRKVWTDMGYHVESYSPMGMRITGRGDDIVIVVTNAVV